MRRFSDISRRAVLAGAASMVARPGRAEPTAAMEGWLATAGMGEAFAAVAIDAGLGSTPEASMGSRLHGIVASPTGSLAVAVGRRPGRTAIVFDHARGGVVGRFAPGEGRVFSGHGRFTPDGRGFFTNEIEPSDSPAGRGILAVREVAAEFAIVAEWRTGGDGPHDLMHWERGIVVANGGIEPHTSMARDVDIAGSGVTLLDAATGEVRAEARTSADLASLSLRHLAKSPAGGMVVAAQDLLADGVARPLLFAVGAAGTLTPFDAPEAEWRQLRGYVGSAAFDRSGKFVGCATPRGNRVAVWRSDGRYVGSIPFADGCGLADTAEAGRFVATSGYGEVVRLAVSDDGVGVLARRGGGPRYDNHIVSVA